MIKRAATAVGKPQACEVVKEVQSPVILGGEVPNHGCWLSGQVVWAGVIFAFREPVADHVTLALLQQKVDGFGRAGRCGTRA